MLCEGSSCAAAVLSGLLVPGRMNWSLYFTDRMTFLNSHLVCRGKIGGGKGFGLMLGHV